MAVGDGLLAAPEAARVRVGGDRLRAFHRAHHHPLIAAHRDVGVLAAAGAEREIDRRAEGSDAARDRDRFDGGDGAEATAVGDSFAVAEEQVAGAPGRERERRLKGVVDLLRRAPVAARREDARIRADAIELELTR